MISPSCRSSAISHPDSVQCAKCAVATYLQFSIEFPQATLEHVIGHGGCMSVPPRLCDAVEHLMRAEVAKLVRRD